MMNTTNSDYQKPPTVLDGFIVPGFPVKVFTCLFFSDCIVFIKTGSFTTNLAGTMHAALGGYSGDGLIMGAMGTLVDDATRENRIAKTAELAAYNIDEIVKAHKRNFKLDYKSITSIEMKGPNFAGEIRFRFYEGKNCYKFRMDKAGKTTSKFVKNILDEYVPNKLIFK